MRQGINAALNDLCDREWVVERLGDVVPLDFEDARDSDTAEKFFFLPVIKNEISAFLAATTDARRLVYAEAATVRILELFDMRELNDLRAAVQRAELRRTIPYVRQQDHSAHTLYLYLLGLYIYASSSRLRTSMESFLVRCGTDSGEPSGYRFMVQWLYASLLHDVGYALQGSEIDRRAADVLLQPSSTIRLFQGIDGRNSQRNADIERARRRLHGLSWRARYSELKHPADVLDELRRLPWAHDAGLDCDDAFDVFNTMNSGLGQDCLRDVERFAYEVAERGYQGNYRGEVDHAIGSGLLLLQFASLWTFVYSITFRQGDFPPARLRDTVVPACFAVLVHNTAAKHMGGKVWALNENPLAYLGILCDELQRWDRFPVGDDYLFDLVAFQQNAVDSEALQLRSENDGVIIEGPQAFCAKSTEILDKRLAGWSDIAAVCPANVNNGRAALRSSRQHRSGRRSRS